MNKIRQLLEKDSIASNFIVVAIAFVILFIRKTDSFLNPQFWAEDGTVFFLQQYVDGASSILEPYAGYLHLTPRLIAFFSDIFFQYESAPLVYNLSSLLLTLLVIVNTLSIRLPISRNNKIIFALTLVCIPHFNNEVFMNITNIQWILAVLLILTLMKNKPQDKHGNIFIQKIFDILVVVVCGLTGPFLVLLTPLFIWKYFQEKDKYTLLFMLVVILISVIQFSFITSSLNEENANIHINTVASLVGQKILGNLFLGKSISYKINSYILSFGYLLMLIILFKHVLYYKNKIIGCLLYTHLCFLFATCYKFKANLDILIPVENGARYFYIPYIMAVWMLIILLNKTSMKRKKIIKTLLILVMISSLASKFHSNSLIDYNWDLYSKQIGVKDISIPINPKGWSMHVKSHK